MKTVNPELYKTTDGESVLLRRADPGFSEAVERLFGAAHPNVSRAVEEFLALEPSSFDHHRLRIVAAAAGVFTDMNHVAHMIRQLRPTHLELTGRPIDLEVAREQFKTSLPEMYRPESKRALVLDLIRSTTIEVLENSPVQNVPESGRAILRDGLRRHLKSGLGERDRVLKSPYFDTGLCEALLDSIEAKLERAEREVPGSLPTLERTEGLEYVVGFASGGGATVVSDEQLLRAWSLAQRCSPDSHMLNFATSNSRLLELAGRSVLDAVVAYQDSSTDTCCGVNTLFFLSKIAASRSTPEDVARDVFQVTTSEPLEVDVIHGDPRLGLLRQEHYRNAESLMDAPSAEDLDRVALEMTPHQLTPSLVANIGPEAALSLLERVVLLPRSVQRELVRYHDLTALQIDRLIDSFGSESFRSGSGYEQTVPELLVRRQLSISDDQLARVLEQAIAFSRESDSLTGIVGGAACNPASGPRALAAIDQHLAVLPRADRITLLKYFALGTESTHVLATLAERATATNDAVLAGRLMSNGVLGKDIWIALNRRFPEVSARESRPQLARHHDPRHRELESKTDFILSGAAPPDRAEAMVRLVALDQDLAYLGERVLGSEQISDRRLAELTTDADIHVALSVATHPRTAQLEDCDGFVLSAERQLADTAYAVEHRIGELPPDRRLRSWDELPNREDAMFERTPLHDLVDGRVVDGLTITVTKSPRELKRLSSEMRNCLSGYTDTVARGDTLIISARTATDVYAAALEVGTDDVGHFVTLGEVNSKFNENKVPISFSGALKSMVEQINSGTLRPIEHESVLTDVTTDVAVTANEVEERHRHGRPRPARRQPIPQLLAHVEGGLCDEQPSDRDAPSLLAQSAVPAETASPAETTKPADDTQNVNPADPTVVERGLGML